ncbi:MAG TPA: hypothetical protein VEV61_11530 [Streptosporangiaceae bacterium]|nr:hypothetical protein [Streptosporangiaceae bacterium]
MPVLAICGPPTARAADEPGVGVVEPELGLAEPEFGVPDPVSGVADPELGVADGLGLVLAAWPGVACVADVADAAWAADAARAAWAMGAAWAAGAPCAPTTAITVGHDKAAAAAMAACRRAPSLIPTSNLRYDVSRYYGGFMPISLADQSAACAVSAGAS